MGKHIFKRTKNKRKLEKLFAGKKVCKCEYCGKKLTMENATFDHVVPLSVGGYDKVKNGAVSCKSCNSFKSSMTKGEFILKLKSRVIK